MKKKKEKWIKTQGVTSTTVQENMGNRMHLYHNFFK